MDSSTLCKTDATADNSCELSRPAHTQALPVVQPLVDIIEDEQHLLLTANLPGVDETQVDVSVEKGLLTIHATTVIDDTGTEKPAGNDDGQSTSVFPHIRYQRSFKLSDDVDVAGITAVVRDGVLRLTLPKSAKAMSTKVTVTGG